MAQAKSNFFFPIIETWPNYFSNPDEGLGTVYERFLLHRMFARLKEQYNIQSVLEAPSFGMTGVSGVNSLWWAREGIVPVVIDHNRERLQSIRGIWQKLNLPVQLVFSPDYTSLPFADQSFDLSYNFAALWFVPRLTSFLHELNRVTKKIIFISVPNRYGIGYQLRLHWPWSPRPPLHYANINARNFVPILKNLGWKLVERGYFDVPPWPDFPLKKEVLFARLKVGFILKILKRKENRPNERVSILDYFSGVRPNLDSDIMKFGFLEKAPWPIRPLWAHHQFYIFVKE